MTQRIGVCSWSLRPRDPEELAGYLASWDGAGCQLALDPIRRGEWDLGRTRAALEGAGVPILSGMMAPEGEEYSTLEAIQRTGGFWPDATFERNLAAAKLNARIARDLGLKLVTLHGGHVPESPDDPGRGVMVERLRAVTAAFAECGVEIALETGQDRAETLLDVLAEIGMEEIGINFDPANVILYGTGDPLDALAHLASNVKQIHIKDAVPSDRPGEEWGTETPMGDGAVDWNGFFDLLRERELRVDLVVEREGGEQRQQDVGTAIERVHGQLHRIGRER